MARARRSFGRKKSPLASRPAAFFFGSPLCETATRLLSVVPHSAGVERANSRMGYLHSRTRNRLKLEKVAKLMAISCNRREEEVRGLGQAQRERAMAGFGVGSLEEEGDEEGNEDEDEEM